MSSGAVVVIGGAGALGRSIIESFKAASRLVVSVDFNPNDQADENVIITNADESVNINTANVSRVICVAGSWQGTPKDFSSYPSVLAGWKALEASNIKPALLAASLATKYNCGLVLISALASRHACPGMVEYGMAKSAVNMLAASIKASVGEGGVLVLMPAVLDTPANRRDMPHADTSHWTPLSELSNYVIKHEAIMGCKFINVKTTKEGTIFEEKPIFV
jgi:dihydropteridine reductase